MELDLEFLRKLDKIAVKLRAAFGFFVNRDNYEVFQQITYDELSQCVIQGWPSVSIFDEFANDTFLIKCPPLEEIDGEEDFEDKFEIYIDKNRKDIELLMHEVAHILLHGKELPYYTPIGKDSGTWEQEQEANYFARAFLIPEDFFIKALAAFSRNDGTVDLDGFSKRFNVSQKLVVERGRDLRVW